MKISVIGTGYVGTVSAACFAELGHEVICVDIDPLKIDMLKRGVPPIYEDGLSELLEKHVGKNLDATSDYDFAVNNSEVSFICVGTPSDHDGKIDLGIVKAASASLGKALRKKKGYHVIVVKSTVVPETTEKVVLQIIEKESGKSLGEFWIAMNPEVLREGKAVHDFMHPDKIVVGSLDKRSGDIVASLYSSLDCEVTRTNPRTAEMIKYVINELINERALVSAYDKMAIENMKRIFPDIEYCNSAIDALRGSDACLIMTEWNEFKSIDREFNVMKNRLIIDGRHMQIPRKDVDYVGLCW